MRKHKKSHRNVFYLFVLICLFVCIFSFQYYQKLHTAIREESKGYLQEVSRRIGENLDRMIQDNFAMLHSMGDYIEGEGSKSLDDIQRLLQNQKNYWDYNNILLVNKNGKAYDIAESRATFLTLDNSIRASLLNKEESMATTQIINNKEYIIFAVPLNGVSVDGEEIIALAASYDPALLDQVMSMTSFDGKAYSQIITKSGTIVTRSSSAGAIKSGYNLLSSLQNAKMDRGSDLNQMKENMKLDIGDQICFLLDGVHRYMVYTPIQPKEWYLLTFVPFETVNGKSDLILKTTLLICGMVALTFCGLTAALFYTFSTNKKKLEHIAYVDEVTGGNTIQRFYELAESILDASGGVQYALVYTNIENFKVLNTQLGRQNCDAILRQFYIYTSSVLTDQECMGRLSADNFCLLVQYEDEVAFVKRLKEWEMNAERYIQQLQVPWSIPVTDFGVYVIELVRPSLSDMVDRAKLALKEPPYHLAGKLRYALYDDQSRRQLYRDKQLADMMEPALKNREFQLYLQPKYHLPEESIGGAEALVRWISKAEGMIYPDSFIPLFEKNGFIVQLDLWMFEEVCRTICDWIERGLTPMKISVNCSRVHFKNPNFLASYEKIATAYQMDRSLLEIELTESVVFGDSERLSKIIKAIRDAGFGCSMDDFGSGYSSLNLIHSIPVDTLKIDKIFFQRTDSEIDRTEAVVGSITNMAQSLSMLTVAEGVEHREQVEMLKRVNCDYIQGYVFARPMNVNAFEELAFGSKTIESR